MHHLVNISIAPVIVVMDDAGNPLSLTAIPLTFALWLPAWLYAWLSGVPAVGHRSRRLRRLLFCRVGT